MVMKEWTNQIVRWWKALDPEVTMETPTDELKISEPQSPREPVRLTLLSENEIRNSFAQFFNNCEDQTIIYRVSEAYDDHNLLKQFLNDLVLSYDLSTLMELYGLSYNDGWTVDRNFTHLVTEFLAGRAGKYAS